MLHHKARVHVVTGKGGVGKTVVSTAMAMALAAEGKKVLLAEVNAHDRVAALLGAGPSARTCEKSWRISGSSI